MKRTGYGILKALYLPVYFLGVHWAQALVELLVVIFLGFFASWYFIVVVAFIHFLSIQFHTRNQFAFPILIQILRFPHKSYIEKK